MEHTDQAVSEVGVGIKVLAVMDHGAAKDSSGQTLLAFAKAITLAEPLDVGIHGELKFLHACGGKVVSQGKKLKNRDRVRIPSNLSAISVSRPLNSSDIVVRASLPIFSPAH